MREVGKKELAILPDLAPHELVAPPYNPEIKNMRDGDLMKRVARGDERAVQELQDRFESLIFKIVAECFKFTRPQDMDDARQDILIKLWQNSDGYDPNIAALSTWITTIAKRHCIDKIRRKQAEDKHLKHRNAMVRDSFEEVSRNPFSVYNPQSSIAHGELRAELIQQVGKLPDTQNLVGLHHGLGTSQSELSAATLTPLGTVKSAMFRALEKLREKIEV